MKRQIIMILLFFSIAPALFAMDQDVKTIEFSSEQWIYKLETSENYFGVRLFDYSKNMSIAIAYSKEGKELFRKGRPNKSNIIFASPAERFNSFIVIFQGKDETKTKAAEDDTITAYSLRTGELLWQSYSVAGVYAISPDGRYLLPQEKAEPDRGIKFNIIDMKDGSVITPQIELKNFHAAWYDPSRIILITQGTKRNPNRTKNPFELVSDKRKPLLREKNSIFVFLKGPNLKGEDKNKYLKRLDEINRELEELEKEVARTRESLPPKGRERTKILHPPGSAKWVARPLEIKIYNWRTNQIKQEKSLDGLAIDGIPVTVVYKQQDDGTSGVTVDSEGNIYILGSYRMQPRKRIVLKMDKALNLLWEYSFSPFGLITKFLIDGKPWFRIGMGDDKSFVFLDPENGNILTPAQITKLSKQAGDFDFSICPLRSNEVKTQTPAIALPHERKILVKGY